MQKEAVLYFMYEIEKRELRARLTAAKYFLNKGFKVVIFQHLEIYLIALFAKPGVVFLKSNSNEFDIAISLMSKRGFRIILFQEEGLHHNYDQISSLTFSKKSARYVDAYLAWHPADADFARNNGITESKIKVVGNLRFELASKIRKPNYYISEKLKLLVIVNFDNTINYVAPKKLDNPEIARSYKEMTEAIKDWSSVEEINRNLYQKLLVSKFSEIFEITLRPYTLSTENKDYFKNVTLDVRPNILDSIVNNDIVIHYGSTVSLESILSGRFSILFNSRPELVDKRIQNCSRVISTIETMFTLLNEISSNRSLLEKYSKSQLALMESNYEIDFSSTEWLRECENRISSFTYTKNWSGIQYNLRLKNLIYYCKIKIKRKVSRSMITKAPELNYAQLASEMYLLEMSHETKVRIWFNRKAVTFRKK